LDGDLYDGTEEVYHPTTCWECNQLKKEVKRLQQLVELLQLPNDFE
jgi:thioredoxin-related protein